MRLRVSTIVMVLYLVFLMLPIYWLVSMSFKTNAEIISDFTLFPAKFSECKMAAVRVVLPWST